MKYTAPEMEFVSIETEDIILTSTGTNKPVTKPDEWD